MKQIIVQIKVAKATNKSTLFISYLLTNIDNLDINVTKLDIVYQIKLKSKNVNFERKLFGDYFGRDFLIDIIFLPRTLALSP